MNIYNLEKEVPEVFAIGKKKKQCIYRVLNGMEFKAKKKFCSSKPQGSLETVYLAPAPPGVSLLPFSQNQFSKDISFIS